MAGGQGVPRMCSNLSTERVALTPSTAGLSLDQLSQRAATTAGRPALNTRLCCL